MRKIAEILCRNTKTDPASNLFLLRMCPWIINIANFTCVYEQSSKYLTISFVFFAFGRMAVVRMIRKTMTVIGPVQSVYFPYMPMKQQFSPTDC